MNVPRKIAALRRDLRRHKEELERIAKLRETGDENVLALPQFAEKYLANIRVGISQLEAEIRKLEAET
jgi:hypothetical protein